MKSNVVLFPSARAIQCDHGTPLAYLCGECQRAYENHERERFQISLSVGVGVAICVGLILLAVNGGL